MKKAAAILLLWACKGLTPSYAQVITLNFREAITTGIENSKQLSVSRHRIDEALAQAEQAKDASLPTAKISAGYSHALLPTQTFYLPSATSDPQKMNLPFDNPLYQASVGISQPVFEGHHLRYARESSNLLLQISKLNAAMDKEEVTFTIIQSYINYYKLIQNQTILHLNLKDIENKLTEIKKYEAQGLATRNDVLRFELEKSKMALEDIALEKNRKIVNYNLDILLGLPDSTIIEEEGMDYRLNGNIPLETYLALAFENRKELSALQFQSKIADIGIKDTQDEKLPVVNAGGNLYFINPSKNILPKNGSYLAPFIVGVNVGWDISSLYKNKNKLAQAKLRKQEIEDRDELLKDQIKTEVHQNYLQYQQALDKIHVLQVAIVQAGENERITESRFQNNLATTTERIDAQTLLYQARINLELAKSDATLAYYTLLKSTGHIAL